MALPAPTWAGGGDQDNFLLLDPHGATYHSLFQRPYAILPVRGVEHYWVSVATNRWAHGWLGSGD
jgi:hypothetical protein